MSSPGFYLHQPLLHSLEHFAFHTSPLSTSKAQPHIFPSSLIFPKASRQNRCSFFAAVLSCFSRTHSILLKSQGSKKVYRSKIIYAQHGHVGKTGGVGVTEWYHTFHVHICKLFIIHVKLYMSLSIYNKEYNSLISCFVGSFLMILIFSKLDVGWGQKLNIVPLNTDPSLA